MVDFDTNALVWRRLGVTVVAASVDSVATTDELATGMRVGYVKAVGEVDAHAAAAATGCNIQTGDRTFLHATGFILKDGVVQESVYATGPIGRFTASDTIKKIEFTNFMAERAARS